MKNPIYNFFNKDEQIKLLIENSEDIITIHDTEGNYLFYGGSAKYKLSVDEIFGKSPYDFFNEEDAKEIVRQIKKIAQTGKQLKIEKELNHFGKKSWYQISLSPIKKNGKVVSVIKICRDITERIKIKQQIVQQKEFLNNIINSISHPLYVIDVKTYNIVLANKAANFNSLPKIQTCYSLTHNSDVACWKNGDECPVKIVGKTMEPCIVEHIHYNEKNEKKITEVHGFPVFDQNNNLVQVIEYNIDITEKKELEKALIIEKEKANESNRLKSAFLANMSHEIRTPMNAIIGFGELLKDENLTIEKKNKFIDIINSSGAHLLDIIEDIIDISKIDAKQIELNITKFKLPDFMTEIFIFFNSQLEREKDKKLKITSKIHKEINYIFADKKRLKQVLINLLSNALKFTNKGIIEICYSTTNDKQILFEVKDCGIGISEKDIHFVFDRFRQVGNRTKSVSVGTGLGLAISKGFVELMGGKIDVKSEEGKGSTFSFTIPLVSE